MYWYRKAALYDLLFVRRDFIGTFNRAEKKETCILVTYYFLCITYLK